ncbi:acyl dehydratase, partial [Pseudomonas ogarae]
MTSQCAELSSPASIRGRSSKAGERRAGPGTTVPEEGLRRGLEGGRRRLEGYGKVCGFVADGLLPPTYAHVLAFALQM